MRREVTQCVRELLLLADGFFRSFALVGLLVRRCRIEYNDRLVVVKQRFRRTFVRDQGSDQLRGCLGVQFMEIGQMWKEKDLLVGPITWNIGNMVLIV